MTTSNFKLLLIHFKLSDRYRSDKVAEAGVRYFKGIFSQTPEFNDYSDLEAINIMITEENNASLIEIPSEEEIKSNLMSMDPDSAPRPDGFAPKFFQSCWDLWLQEILRIDDGGSEYI
ncbi:hypothetical protein KY284_012876 [Solanum tuberosum]|nr:hypothetical protein KY284_012876 [Solanum tuberosum]